MGVSVDWDRACFTMDPVGELLFVCLFVCFFVLYSQTIHNLSTFRRLRWHFFTFNLNPLTPMSDQERISPFNINIISSRLVMTIKEDINQGIIY